MSQAPQTPLPRTCAGASCGRLANALTSPAAVCLLLAVATLAVYAPLARCDFATFDDDDYVRRNGWVQAGLTWAGAGWAFTTGHAANWHPLTWLSLMLDRELFGPGATGFHWVNLLFHTANGVLLFLVLRRLTGACWRSAVAAGLFALHPLHVESVAWIAERKDVLSAFFGLLALWCYAAYATARDEGKPEPRPGGKRTRLSAPVAYAGALGCFALGLMSKPMLVTWPFVLLLLDWWPLRRFGSAGEWSAFWRLVPEKVPFFTLSVLSCVATFLVQKRAGAVGTLMGLPLAARLENAALAYVQYLARTFWPFDLAVIYPHPDHWPVLAVMAAAALMLGLSAAAVWLGRQSPFLFTGWFWFVGTLVPVIGLVQIGMQARADRYTYLPLIGLFIVIVWAVDEFIARSPAIRQAGILASVLSVLALVACGLRTADQLRHWRDGGALARHAIAVTKANYIAYGILGGYLSDHGQSAEAIESYRQAIQIRPAFPQTHNNLGLALARAGQLPEAAEAFRQELQISPHFAEAHNNLGNVLSAQGRDTEAQECFRRALTDNPDQAEALNNLGRIAARHEQDAEAIANYRRALGINPFLADAWFNLGNALARKRELSEAADAYRHALRLQPDDAEAHRNLGWTLSQLGQRSEAIEHLAEASRLKPEDAGAKEQLRRLGVGN